MEALFSVMAEPSKMLLHLEFKLFLISGSNWRCLRMKGNEVQLADSLVPLEIKPGISLATVSAVLHTKDNKHVLQLPPKPPQPPASKKRKRVSDDVPECKPLKPLLSGSIPVDQFVQTLEKHGFSDVKVEDTAKGHIVLLQEAETLIQIEEDSTHIICDNDEPLRVKLRDLVLKFLQKF